MRKVGCRLDYLKIMTEEYFERSFVDSDGNNIIVLNLDAFSEICPANNLQVFTFIYSTLKAERFAYRCDHFAVYIKCCEDTVFMGLVSEKTNILNRFVVLCDFEPEFECIQKKIMNFPKNT